jgi:hypothetical protein
MYDKRPDIQVGDYLETGRGNWFEITSLCDAKLNTSGCDSLPERAAYRYRVEHFLNPDYPSEIKPEWWMIYIGVILVKWHSKFEGELLQACPNQS